MGIDLGFEKTQFRLHGLGFQFLHFPQVPHPINHDFSQGGRTRDQEGGDEVKIHPVDQKRLGVRQVGEFEVIDHHLDRRNRENDKDEQPKIGQKALLGQVIGDEVKDIEINDSCIYENVNDLSTPGFMKRDMEKEDIQQNGNYIKEYPEQGVVHYPLGQHRKDPASNKLSD